MIKNQNFPKALEAVISGKRIARECWNNGHFIYRVPASKYPVQTIVAKNYFGENSTVYYHPYLALKTQNDEIEMYFPPNIDIFAEDWIILD